MLKFKVASFLNQWKPFFLHNLWAGLSTLVKALMQLFLLKIVILQFGESGLGIVGQAMSCLIIFQNLLSGGILSFTITSVSKASKESPKDRIYGTTALWSIACVIISLIVAVLFSSKISQAVFLDSQYSWYFIALAFLSVCFSAFMLSNGIISSYRNVKALFFSNLITLVLGVISFYLLLKSYNLIGALIGILIVYSLQSLVYFIVAYSMRYISLADLRPVYDKPMLKQLVGFSVLFAITGVLSNLYQVFIRSFVIGTVGLSWAEVGRWQSVTKISDVIINFISVTIMTAYLPALSKAHSIENADEVLKNFSKKIIPLIILSCGTVAIFAPILLRIIYSAELISTAPLLRWQMLGDVFKFSTCVFSYFFMARAKIVVLMVYEIIGVCILTVVTIALVNTYQLNGLVYANLISGLLAMVTGSLIYWGLKTKFTRFIKA